MRGQGWRWARLVGIIATAVVGLGSSYAIWSADDAPDLMIAFSGVLALLGAVAAVFLLLVVIVTIIEDVRPSMRFRRPAVPLSLAHREAALFGRRRYRMHPISFWGVFTLNNRFVFGFMLCEPPEYVDLQEPL